MENNEFTAGQLNDFFIESAHQFGMMIMHLCISEGLYYVTLAGKIDVDPRTILRIIQGTANFEFKTYTSLCRVFNLTVNYV